MEAEKSRVTTQLEQHCLDHGLHINGPRRAILHILEDMADYPTAVEIHQRVTKIKPRTSIATVYRMLNLLAEKGILNRIELRNHKARFEKSSSERHEHLIDIQTGTLIAFRNESIEALIRQTVEQFGYRLVDYRLELFGEPEKKIA